MWLIASLIRLSVSLLPDGSCDCSDARTACLTSCGPAGHAPSRSELRSHGSKSNEPVPPIEEPVPPGFDAAVGPVALPHQLQVASSVPLYSSTCTLDGVAYPVIELRFRRTPLASGRPVPASPTRNARPAPFFSTLYEIVTSPAPSNSRMS